MKTTFYLCLLAVLLAVGCGKEAEYAQTSRAEFKNSPAPAEDAMAGVTLASQNRSREAPPVAPKTIPQRAVIRNGSLAVRVENVEKAEDKVVSLVQSLGGYIDSTDSTDLATATPSLSMTIRVPSNHFDDVLDHLEKLGTRLSKKINTEDVTGSIADMAARLKIMRAQEEVYRRMLSNSRSNQEMMDVQDKLMTLRGTIEGLEAQHKSLSQLAALSTIDLKLQQSAEGAVAATNDPSWAKETWGAATSSLGNVARVGGSLLIWALVFSPLWLPAAWVVRQAVRSKKVPAGGASPQFEVMS